jgi:hypothetical protein
MDADMQLILKIRDPWDMGEKLRWPPIAVYVVNREPDAWLVEVRDPHHLKEAVLYPIAHRQYVFSIPKIVIKFFLYIRALLGTLSQCAVTSLSVFFSNTIATKAGIPGIVVAIQTFDDYARYHPHIHALVADGLCVESGFFFVMPKADPRPLGELFRAPVLRMRKKDVLIDGKYGNVIH